MKTRLIVDALTVRADQGGIRAVGFNLISGLAKFKDLSILILSSTDMMSEWPEFADNVKVIDCPMVGGGPASRYLWKRKNLQKYINKPSETVVLSLTPDPVPHLQCPHIVIVHDITPLLTPGISGWRRFLRFAISLKYIIKNADQVAYISETTMLDVTRWLGADAMANARVIHNSSQPLPEVGLAESQSDLEQPSYALYAGALLPHKNVRTIVQAFVDCPNDAPKELWLVGPGSDEDLGKLFSDLSENIPVRHLGFVSEDKLDRLYREAEVVLFPSLSEGYGMPVVEALERGCSVISTRLPVVEELVGDRVHYVRDTLSPISWQKAMSYARNHTVRDSSPLPGDLLDWNITARSYKNLIDEALFSHRKSSKQ